MNTRIASMLAAALMVAAPVSSAFARTVFEDGHPRGAFVAGSYEPYDVETTGSINDRFFDDRGIDSSAKGGNANQPERAFPQFGTTSGGPGF